MNLNGPEGNMTSPETGKAYKELLRSVRSGSCTTEELIDAKNKGIITVEQFNTLVLELAQSFQKLATKDFLTGLSNRSLQEPQFNKIKTEINSGGKERKNETQSAVFILFDVKNFKAINDTYGHSVGDRALKIVAQKLEEGTRRDDLLFRHGGDEFVAILPMNTSNPRTIEEVFKRKKSKINEALVVLAEDGTLIRFSISMGFSIYNKGDKATAEDMIKKADEEMYKNKQEDKRPPTVA